MAGGDTTWLAQALGVPNVGNTAEFTKRARLE